MKKGFTLAEALITLGIIGVVAALAAPALNSAVQKSKVGPSLAKFKSTTENGIQRMLAEKSIDSISTLDGMVTSGKSGAVEDNIEVFIENLQPYLKISKRGEGTGYCIYQNDGTEKINVAAIEASGINAMTNTIGCSDPGYTTADGMVCWFYINPVRRNDASLYINDNALAGSVVVDINGEPKPNKIGKDVFAFNIFENGTMVPFGSIVNFCKDDNPSFACNSYDYNWKNGKSGVCNSTDMTSASDNILGLNCTASVLENARKVIYKY